jgi:hypothetical protein
MTKGAIPVASTLAIQFNLPEPNVDKLTITFAAGKGASNDETAKITPTEIPAAKIEEGKLFDAANTPTVTSNILPFSMFSITNAKIKTTQSFVANEINKCFSWVSSSVEINFGGEVVKFDKPEDFIKPFKYVSKDKDKPAELNALKFTYTPPKPFFYMYCALVCGASKFPSDDAIVAFKTPSTPLVQYYMAQFNDKNEKTLLFKNLVRNMDYKVKCILKNTAAAGAINNTDNQMNFTFDPTPKNSTNTIRTAKSENKTCIQYISTKK